MNSNYIHDIKCNTTIQQATMSTYDTYVFTSPPLSEGLGSRQLRSTCRRNKTRVKISQATSSTKLVTPEGGDPQSA